MAITPPAYSSSKASNFFEKIFYHPGDNKTGVMIIALVAIGIVVGAVYGIKKLHDKYNPPAPE